MTKLPINLKIFISFKFNQHLNITGLTMTNEEKEQFIKEQIASKSNLFLGWLREAIAAGAI